MVIYKVFFDTLIHKKGKSYTYLCDLCRAFCKKYQHPEAKVRRAPNTIKKCDGHICKPGPDLLLAAIELTKRQVIKERMQKAGIF